VITSKPAKRSEVTGLVYITAFAPDKGESVATLMKDSPPGAPVPPILPHRRLLFLDKAEFHATFAGTDGDPEKPVMADSQAAVGRSGS